MDSVNIRIIPSNQMCTAGGNPQVGRKWKTLSTDSRIHSLHRISFLSI